MQVMIRYKVRRDQVERNLELLHAVYEELASVRPEGMRYASFQLEDEVSFVDFAVFDGPGPGPLPLLKAFQRFRTTLDARCDELPVLTELHQAGSYRFH
ncbi:hypothetical protein [Streptosporangium roseum]|uniref:hypothetical protein n=1 Tax=Streptosporangium roseum TaxID=2001 RepID=UPI0033279205